MRYLYKKNHARYLYIKRNVENFWGARYTLGVLYLSKNTVLRIYICYECIQLVLFKYLIYAQEMDAINTKDLMFEWSGSLFFMVKSVHIK
jgi:hypothetical protein